MHKIVTGAIAGAAGVALLLGGAGTFALWNASASSAASAVSAGTLTLSANNDGAWTDITNGRATAIDPTKALMVPGNTFQFTQTLNIGATGQDLKANLTYANQSITGDAALLAATTKTLAVTSTSASVVQSSSNSNTFVVSPSSSTSTVKVVFTVTLPSSATTGQGGSINLSALAFTLTQTAIGS
ncbi:alternate-type signal peptide domain-containing protein [Curtobacterium flaccumfaciens]|uniref:alternate-type signal peptide domain-containing protein n=1 Tax=Curtobacterium flaccumfaciens TaxID=2035 RepID=UPI000FFF5E06|nr:alternate-type signal peptide domain-containing protein [Curtobacterium flaccumfaciens]MCS0645893.1 alternate-type signal peptide domain-containing protein [Curtobacterium flaccumfaciens pv. flaccumfaciens]MCS6525484.1 alternate-type signal peptide domain-containing protein [Curtobacterium flaccumfaciens pv. flaccumfaciens]MCS6529066.1 alternate-type signal peptide domain-containing protein [Curtobacterium flaccumfaciens pv. flaccumfaciens]NUU10673.1 alternate-type signal peptide domain-cont